MSKSALDAPRGTPTFHLDPDVPVIIGLDTKHTRRGDGAKDAHPLYDERAIDPVDETLVLNVMAYNVKQPVTVVKDGDQVIVVDGRQRVKAARLANQRLRKRGEEPLLIPVIVDRKTSEGATGHVATMLLLNEFRKNDPPLVRARKLADYLAMGRTPDQAAITIGVDVRTVNNLVKLLDLAPEVQKAVDSKKISASAARPLADLSQTEQVAKLDEIMTEYENGGSDEDSVTRPLSPVSRRAVENKIGRETTVSMTPSRTEVNRLYKACEDGIPDDLDVDEAFVRGVRWARGDLPTSKIKGLMAVIVKKPPPREPTEPGKPPKKKKGKGKK